MKVASPPASPLDAKRSPGAGCAMLFGLLFAVVGFTAFWFVTLRPVLRASRSADWTPTQCVILSSELDSKNGSEGGTVYRVAIRYRYTFSGQSHEGERYNFAAGHSNVGVKGMREAVNRLPAGSLATCYVDPSDPASAVLSRETPSVVWAGSFTLLFPAFGILFIFLTWRSARKQRELLHSPFGSSSAWTGPGAASFESSFPVAPGETVMKPSGGRLAAFVFLTLFALFWNGIVSIFVYHAFKDFGRGFIGWFLPIFLIPFVLIGLVVLLCAVQAFSRLFAPPIEVKLDPSLLRLGGRIPFSWRLGGGGVRRLVIRLNGREEATYRQGTDTRTDRSLFFHTVVFESTDARALIEGRAWLDLPAEGVAPAFAAPNNKLVWELAFEGEIPWRADLNDTFALPVRGPEHPSVPPTSEPRLFAEAGLTLWTVDRLAPGDALVFTLLRDASAAPGPLTARLGWFTEGRGMTAATIVWRETVANLAPGSDRTFEVKCPDAPWSFSGKLISVQWRLEVLDGDEKPLLVAPLVFAPGGSTVPLAEQPKPKRGKWNFPRQ